MKRNLRYFIRYWLALTLVAILAVAISACASTSSPTTSSRETPTLAPTKSATPSESPTTRTPTPIQGQRANGTLTKIDGNTLTLTTAQGQVTVKVSSNTSIQKTTIGTLSDLNEGQSLTVIGRQDTNGNITATSLIIIRQRGQGAPSIPPAGATPSPSGRPTRPGNGTNPAGGTGRGASGTLTKIDGNALTLTTAQGQVVTVKVSSDTSIQKTTIGTLSDLNEGGSLTVIGSQDANGNIIATSIIIRSQSRRTKAEIPGASVTGIYEATTYVQ